MITLSDTFIGIFFIALIISVHFRRKTKTRFIQFGMWSVVKHILTFLFIGLYIAYRFFALMPELTFHAIMALFGIFIAVSAYYIYKREKSV